MTNQVDPPELHSIYGHMAVPYTYAVGTFGSKFFIALRDEKKIMGSKCPQCNVVYMPPRSICSKCFSQIDQWVELSGQGTVQTYTVVNYKEATHPPDVEPPFVYGVIQLDGADTGLTHIIADVDPEKVKIGMKVKAVFREERVGNMLDIKHFKPV